MNSPAENQLLEKIKKYSFDKGMNPFAVNRNQCYVMIVQALYLILVELKKISSNLGTGLSFSEDNDK